MTDKLTIPHRLGCAAVALLLPAISRHLGRCQWCSELYARVAAAHNNRHRLHGPLTEAELAIFEEMMS